MLHFFPLSHSTPHRYPEHGFCLCARRIIVQHEGQGTQLQPRASISLQYRHRVESNHFHIRRHVHASYGFVQLRKILTSFAEPADIPARQQRHQALHTCPRRHHPLHLHDEQFPAPLHHTTTSPASNTVSATHLTGPTCRLQTVDWTRCCFQ